MKLKAKIIFEWEYEANLDYYGTEDPIIAAEIDKKTLEEDNPMLHAFLKMCHNRPVIEILPIKNK